MKSEHTMPIFYICPICGNLVEMVRTSGKPLTCCNKEMLLLTAGSTDGKQEFHIPVFEIDDNMVSVKIGQEPHPMTPEHHISWIELVTDRGTYRKCVSHKEEARTCFRIGKKETVQAVYAYCNNHGLWAALCST